MSRSHKGGDCYSRSTSGAFFLFRTVVVEHLLEMGHVPIFVDAVPGESAPDVIEHAAGPHGLEGAHGDGEGRVAGHGGGGGGDSSVWEGPEAEEGVDLGRPWELRGGPAAAARENAVVSAARVQFL